MTKYLDLERSKYEIQISFPFLRLWKGVLEKFSSVATTALKETQMRNLFHRVSAWVTVIIMGVILYLGWAMGPSDFFLMMGVLLLIFIGIYLGFFYLYIVAVLLFMMRVRVWRSLVATTVIIVGLVVLLHLIFVWSMPHLVQSTIFLGEFIGLIAGIIKIIFWSNSRKLFSQKAWSTSLGIDYLISRLPTDEYDE